VAANWRTRLDRGYWAANVAGGAAIAVACSLPAIEIGQSGFIGAGQSQKSFEFDRTLTLITYLRPGTFIYLVGAVVLIGAGVYGLVRGDSMVLAGIVCAVAIVALTHNAFATDHLSGRWPEGHGGVYGCDESLPRCAGGYLYPAIRDLDRDILRSPTGQRPGFELLDANGFRSRALGGWRLLLITLWILTPLALFRLFRYRMRWWTSAIAAGGLMVVALAWWLAASFPSD
jgi:hypothetical protein